MNKICLCLALAVLAACGGPSKKAMHSLNVQKNAGKATYAHLFYNGYHPLLDEVTFKLDSTSVDDSYGYTQANPVMVSGATESGAYNQRRFLNALLGPAGETVTYTRRGSCCPFNSPNGFMNGGLLDLYEVTIAGQSKPVVLYLNLYDKGILRAPKGFTFKNK
jgi:hypothetical protein